MRSAATGLALLAGVILLVLPLTTRMPGRTADAERILDRFAFLTAGDSPDRYLRDAALTREGTSLLLEAEQPPAATRDAIEAAQAFSVRYSRQLEAVQDDFAALDDIPVAGVPLTATSWAFLGAGAIAVALALWRGRAAALAMLLLGALLLAGPLASGAIGKAQSAERVRDFASRGLSQRAAVTALGASKALDELVAGTDVLDEGRPRIAPRLVAFLDAWPVIGARLYRLAYAVAASVRSFDDTRRLPIAMPVYALLGCGALLLAAGALRLASPRPRG